MTVTVTDGGGLSDYFTRVVDGMGAMTLVDLDGETSDVVEVQVQEAVGVNIDSATMPTSPAMARWSKA